MAKETEEEIDIFYLFRKATKLLKDFIKLGFYAINFIKQQWLILLILFIGGVILGYYSDKSKKGDQETKIILRTNFKTANYTYNALENLIRKIENSDTIFLKENGFRTDTLEISKIEINPYINMADITESFDPDNRALESILRNVEFEADTIVSQSFKDTYKYHLMDISLSKVANENTVNKIFDYLNGDPMIKEIAKAGKENIETTISYYNKMVQQTDTAIAEYQKRGILESPSSQAFVVEKDFNIPALLFRKIEFQDRMILLKEELVYSKDAVIAINKPVILKAKKSLLQKGLVIYPLLLIFTFLFLAWLRYVYNYLKKISTED